MDKSHRSGILDPSLLIRCYNTAALHVRRKGVSDAQRCKCRARMQRLSNFIEIPAYEEPKKLMKCHDIDFIISELESGRLTVKK